MKVQQYLCAVFRFKQKIYKKGEKHYGIQRQKSNRCLMEHVTRSLDRNGIVCNNILALAGNTATMATAIQLSSDTEYDLGKTWWKRFTSKIHNWWSSIPTEQKVAAAAILIVASVAAAFFTGGASLGADAGLLSSITAAPALAVAAKAALIKLAIGIGFAVAGWAISSTLSGDWSLGNLENSIADSVFFTGAFMFVSASINALKYVYRADLYPMPEKAVPDLGKKLDYAFGKATGSQHNIDRSQAMLRELERIGIGDSVAGRSLLRENLIRSYYTSNNIAKLGTTAGSIVKDSLLAGIYGFLKVQSTWIGNRLITIILMRH